MEENRRDLQMRQKWLQNRGKGTGFCCSAPGCLIIIAVIAAAVVLLCLRSCGSSQTTESSEEISYISSIGDIPQETLEAYQSDAEDRATEETAKTSGGWKLSGKPENIGEYLISGKNAGNTLIIVYRCRFRSKSDDRTDERFLAYAIKDIYTDDDGSVKAGRIKRLHPERSGKNPGNGLLNAPGYSSFEELYKKNLTVSGEGESLSKSDTAKRNEESLL